MNYLPLSSLKRLTVNSVLRSSKQISGPDFVRLLIEQRGLRRVANGDSGETPVGTPIVTNSRSGNHHPAFQSCSNEEKIMSNPKMKLVGRTTLFLPTILAIAFAVGCDSGANSNTPTTTAPSPTSTASPATESAAPPATNPSPVASPSPAASPAATVKTNKG